MKKPADNSVSLRGSEVAKNLGRKIRLGRQARGFSQADLASRARISLPSLVRMEAGQPGTALGMWINVFEVLGLLGAFGDMEDAATDAAARAALDRRVRKRKPPLSLDF